jgi:hypothetical protein
LYAIGAGAAIITKAGEKRSPALESKERRYEIIAHKLETSRFWTERKRCFVPKNVNIRR